MTAWPGSAGKNRGNWPDYGGGPDSSHYVDLNQINKSNVSQLDVAWVYPAGDDHAYLFNPIIVDDELWKVAASTQIHPLAAWGPPVPGEFLFPSDLGEISAAAMA